MDILIVIANLISAFATFGTFCIAFAALHSWRKELLGAKKIELAHQIMISVHEIQDALIYSRLEQVSYIEIKEVEAWIYSEKTKYPEHTEIYPERFYFLVPHHRLEKYQGKIDEFRNLANKASLYWGNEIYRLFYELGNYTLQLRIASKKLYYNDTNKNYSDLLKIIFSGKDDQISKNINDIVEEFRINLEPVYKDKQITWNKLRKSGNEA